MLKTLLRRVSRSGTTLGEEALARLAEYARMSVDEVLARLGTDRDGLTIEEAEKRLEEYGLNEVVHEKPAPWYVHLVNSFASPFTAILLFIIVVTYITDVLFAPPTQKSWVNIIIISVIILLSGFIQFIQEYRSVIEAEKLKAMVSTTAAVKRKGVGVREVRVEELVPGDIVYLAAGDMVPADVRIIAAKDFFVNQAILTGESEPVEKYPELRRGLRSTGKLTLYDLDNIAFMGTSVVSGTAVGVVVATGENTYLGSMAKRLVGAKTLTGFEKGLTGVGRVFLKFMAVMVPIVFLLNFTTKGDWLEALLFALAVAVGLTPQMLPLIVTVSLARGAVVMAKHKTIVKRLDAIQNFGAMDILCTDKTGTLTMGKMVLVEYLDVRGNEYRRSLHYAYLNSYFHTGLRNPLDMAILEHGEARGLKGAELEKVYRKVDEIPFDFTRRRVSVVVEDTTTGKRELVTKGAVREVLSICNRVELDGGVVPLTEDLRESILELVARLHDQGMRVLAIARKEEIPLEGVSVADEADMVLVGFLAFLDPPKDTAPDAVKALRDYGVEIKVLTGDNEVIASKVAAKVGIPVKKVVVGDDISSLSDEELSKIVEEANVFARITPVEKTRIIRALRSRGYIVGFLGDGVNDAPAMRDADVAISVENAVDIAKESADMILLERSLTVLREGIVKGREAFGNIVKYIKITASSNFGNVFSILVASTFLPFLPMTPVQILFLNLVYDFTMMLIPWDRMDEEYIRKPRRWNGSDIGRFMVVFGPISSIFDIATYALMYHVVGPHVIGAPYHSLDEPLKSRFVSLFQTGWFVESLWTQTMVVNMLRTEKIPFIQSRPSKTLLLAMITGLTVGTLAPYTPLGALLGFTPLPLVYYLIVLIPNVTAYLILAQLVKTMYVRRYGSLL